jgi:hypothetical protein
MPIIFKFFFQKPSNPSHQPFVGGASTSSFFNNLEERFHKKGATISSEEPWEQWAISVLFTFRSLTAAAGRYHYSPWMNCVPGDLSWRDTNLFLCDAFEKASAVTSVNDHCAGAFSRNCF